jgi:predicted nucleotidyltransferase
MDDKLDQFVERVKAASKENLKAVVLFGSAVSGEFHAKHSDLNLLCLVGAANIGALELLRPEFSWWVKQKQPLPLVFTLDELRRSADIFAIELIDIKAHHRMLFGEDFLNGLAVPLRLHRHQIERELHTNWLRLRQRILAIPNGEPHLELMLASISTFTTLFRHTLIAMGEPAPERNREAIERVAHLSGADPGGFLEVLDIREGKKNAKTMDIEAALQRFLAFVEAVTNEVDHRFADI